MKKALIILDCINEIVHPEGKLAQKGYPQFLREHNTISKINSALQQARDLELPVLFVNLGFSEDYRELNTNSPILGKAQEFGILQKETWSTEIFEEIEIRTDDQILYKTRVSGLSSQEVLNHLNDLNISHLLLGGVATQLAVESTVRQAHDLDFAVTVLEDLCGTVSQDVHERSLNQMSAFAKVAPISEELQE